MMTLSIYNGSSSKSIVIIFCILFEINHAQTLPSDSRRLGNSNDSPTILRPTEITRADDYYYNDYDGDYDEMAPGKVNKLLIFLQSTSQ